MNEIEIVELKDWFINKNFSQNEAYALRVADFKIIKETEKAYRLKAMTDFGNLLLWAPKSVCITRDQFMADKELTEQKEPKMNAGLQRNMDLLLEAKTLGIKGVRKGMKTKTLERKIAEFKIAN